MNVDSVKVLELIKKIILLDKDEHIDIVNKAVDSCIVVRELKEIHN